MAVAESRQDRRRSEVRTRIVAVAARRFATAGYRATRFDDIAIDADVARATVFNHFENKAEILVEVLRPLLEDAVARLGKLASLRPRAAVDALLGVYLALWHTHRDALRVSYRVQDEPLGALASLHGRFVHDVVAVLERAARSRALRLRSGVQAARAMSRVAIPLLEVFDNDPDCDALFVDAVRGMLLRDSPKRATPRTRTRRRV